jgi:outer membrane receptor protein involved in Fe transport
LLTFGEILSQKNMKHLLLLFLGGLLSASAIAQTVTVRGKLVSDSDNNGLPYATISVAGEATPDNSIRRFATDADGTFSTTLEPGTYIFTFHFVGMNELKQTIEVPESPSTLNIGNIALSEASTELGEVSVVAQRPLVRVEIDRLFYSVQDDPEASTQSVLDLMRKVPLITIDGEDNIQLRGSTNYKIYLNGKPSNMISNNPREVLRSMPASSIKDIEIITDPGARYDAEGVGGIINIITDKRVDDGYSGSVGARAGTFGDYGGNAFLNAKYGKFGFSGNISRFQQRQPESTSWSERKDFENTLTQTGTNDWQFNGMFSSAMISFEPDTLNLFSVSINGWSGRSKNTNNRDFLSVGTRPYQYNQLSENSGTFGDISMSADYQRSFSKKDEMLTFSYRFQNNPNNSSSWFGISNSNYSFFPSGYQQKSDNRASGNEHTGQVDYVNPLTKKHVMEVGGKFIFRHNFSEADHWFRNQENLPWEVLTRPSNDLDHQQQITSGYAGYTFRESKFSLKTGLRAEYTSQTIIFGDTPSFGNSYFDLVPSAAVSYQLKPTTTLRLNYNKRINRPGIWQLNPYVYDTDPTNIHYGNPDLNSENTHSFSLSYSHFHRKYNINASMNYNFSNNAITWYQFEKDGVINHTVANIGSRKGVGLNLSGRWSPTQKFMINLNGNINYSDLSGSSDFAYSNSGFAGNAFTNMSYTFPKDWRLSANGGFFTPWVQLQSKNSTHHFHGFNLQKSFLDKKLDVSMNISSPFMKTFTRKNESWGTGFTQQSEFVNHRRSVGISVTYRFGNLRSQITRVQRGITNDDVMSGGGGEGGGQQ